MPRTDRPSAAEPQAQAAHEVHEAQPLLPASAARRAWCLRLGCSAVAAGLASLSAACAAPGSQPLVAHDPRVLRRIAWGSCTDQTKPQPIWDTVLASRPDLFIFAGDNVYASGPLWTIGRLDAAYARQAAEPSFARLRQQLPHLAIWDDHDYGLNDGGAEWAHKQAAKDAFLQFWQVPADDPRRQREGLYHAKTFGPPGQRVQVVVLDTRWFRSRWQPTDVRNAPGKERFVPDADPAKSMLGAAQWAWLAEQLRQPADVRLIVSSIQLVAEGHGFERWGLLPLERQRFYDLIASTGARGVVVLSGDRHVGGVYRETRGVPYPITDVTSSGITHTWRDAPEPGPNRLGPLFTELHFGELQIDWPARRLTIGLRDLQGQPQRQHTLALAELQPR